MSGARKIIEALERAKRAANCEHRNAAPIFRVPGPERWECPECEARFVRFPTPYSSEPTP